MKLHSMTLWIGVALALTASNGSKAGVPLSAAGDGHDTVPVSVDGRGPYPFILDSGADSSAVYQWFADQALLKKVPNGSETLSGQTGSTKVSIYQIDDIGLEGRHLQHVKAYGLPNRHDTGHEAGILGNDFMDGTITVFDYPCHRVEIHTKPVDVRQVIGNGAAPVQAKQMAEDSLLALPVMVNGFSSTALLDTGSRNTRMNPRFAAAAGIDAGSSLFHDDEAIYGANSHKMVPRKGPIGSIDFAGVSIKNATAQVIDLPVFKEEYGDKPAMLLGADLLTGYRLVYDHQARQIWLRPSTCKPSS